MPAAATDALGIVAQLVRGWEMLDAAAIGACLTPDAVWHNMPYPAIVGRDKVVASIERFLADMASCHFQIRYQAEVAPGVVLNERIDQFRRHDGSELAIPVMGCFELRDGLVAAWRDYFDSRVMTA